MTTTSSAGEHATTQPTTNQKRIIDDVLLLYQLHPSETAYSHYHPTATFHDPVSIAEGLDSIRSQFNGMPKLFAESTTQQCDMLAPPESSEDTTSSSGSKIALNLTQHYVFKSPIPFKEKGTEKTVNSKVTLHLDGDGLITRHDEEWDFQGNKDGKEGFMGKLMEGRKKVGAMVVDKSVPSDPSKV